MSRTDGETTIIFFPALPSLSRTVLKRHGIIKDDGQKYIPKFYFDTFVDAENPRIEVQITELTAEQAKMQLVDLLKDLYWERGD